MSEPKVIYLGPACEADTGDGRTWAEDNPWPDCECGHRPVQYVLGETFERMKAERDALQLRLNAADQRIDELTAQHHSEDSLDMVGGLRVVVDPTLAPDEMRLVLPADAERERLTAIIENYPNGDPLEYNAALRKIQL